MKRARVRLAATLRRSEVHRRVVSLSDIFFWLAEDACQRVALARPIPREATVMNGHGNRFMESRRTDLIQHIRVLAGATPTISATIASWLRARHRGRRPCRACHPRRASSSSYCRIEGSRRSSPTASEPHARPPPIFGAMAADVAKIRCRYQTQRDTARRKAAPVAQSAIVQQAVPLRRAAQALDAAFDQVTREYCSFDLT